MDHGKSLLVRNLTNIDPDRLKEEKDRGLTIDLGFAYTHHNNLSLGFIDVPGHRKFIHNMLAGISIIDMALLIVAADDGPMPQTLEHLNILRLLEIRKIAVVMTRIDRCTPDQVDTSVNRTLKLFHDRRLPEPPVFRVSNLNGEGLNELKTFLNTSARTLPGRSTHGHFRLAIDRTFVIKGAGTIVTGSVFSGRLNVGDQITLLPANTRARVRSIHCQDKASGVAEAGDRCALNLTGTQLDKHMIHRGDWITTMPRLSPSDVIHAKISLLDHSLSIGHQTRVHLHTAANHVVALLYPIDCKEIRPGKTGFVECRFKEEINSWNGDRLILRDESGEQVIGGGCIIDPMPEAGRSDRALLRQRLSLLDNGDYGAYLDAYPQGTHLSRLQNMLNLDEVQSNTLLDQLAPIRIHLNADSYLISRDAWQKLRDDLLSSVLGWHRDNPQTSGMNETLLRQSLKLNVPEQVFLQLLDSLIREKRIERDGNRVSLPGTIVKLGDPETFLWQKIKPMLEEQPLQPPVLHDLAKRLDRDIIAIQSVIPALLEAKLVWKPVKNRIFLPEARKVMEDYLFHLSSATDDGCFTAADFRDITGMGRNLAIEILEYFDYQNVTLRLADKRKLKFPLDEQS